MPPPDKNPDLNLENVRVVSPRGMTSATAEDSLLETQAFEHEQLRVEVEKLRVELDSFKQDVRQRKTFAPKLYLLACCWLICVIGILLLQGFSEGRFHLFRLNDGVLVALLGTTTVNVVGLFYVVAKYLFPDRNSRFVRDSDTKIE